MSYIIVNAQIHLERRKNKLLKETRGISFEQIIEAIGSHALIAELKNPNHVKYKNQSIYVVKINNYAYCIPYVRQKQTIFLKTIYASRKYKKLYLKEEK